MRTEDGKPYREFRCTKCRQLLGLEYIYSGRLSIKCYNCGKMNNINFRTTKQELVKLFNLPKTLLITGRKGGEN